MHFFTPKGPHGTISSGSALITGLPVGGFELPLMNCFVMNTPQLHDKSELSEMSFCTVVTVVFDGVSAFLAKLFGGIYTAKLQKKCLKLKL